MQHLVQILQEWKTFYLHKSAVSLVEKWKQVSRLIYSRMPVLQDFHPPLIILVYLSANMMEKFHQKKIKNGICIGVKIWRTFWKNILEFLQ